MCFSPQRRAIVQHLNFKKSSETVSFLRFWLQNVLLATAACNFSTSQLQKVVRTCSVLYILTSKCASRHSGVQFFHIATSKSGPNMWSVLYILTSKCSSRHSGVQFLISPLTTWLRTRRFNEPTFRLTRHTNHWRFDSTCDTVSTWGLFLQPLHCNQSWLSNEMSNLTGPDRPAGGCAIGSMDSTGL